MSSLVCQTVTVCLRGSALCLQEFPWIATEKDFFGKPGSDYDFEAQDVQAAFEEYEAANQSLQRLANKVNRKVPPSAPPQPPTFPEMPPAPPQCAGQQPVKCCTASVYVSHIATAQESSTDT